MSTRTYTFVGSLTIVGCGKCHAEFGVTPSFDTRGRQYGYNIWCPYCGHRMRYGEQEIDRLRQQLEVAEENQKFWREQTQVTERRLAATKGVVTRTKRRIANGVCPCCKRSFANVKAHMDSQHPDYAEKA